jgi:hypothetical protein
MKRIVSILFITSLVLGVGCKKGEVISDVKSLGTGAYVTLVKATNLRIDYANINNTSVSITVKEYGNPADKIKIYVTKGGINTDKTKWKVVKEVPYSGETVLTVKATEIATALGVQPVDIVPGGQYTLYNEVITKDGRSFDLTNTPSTFAGNSNYNMAMSWTAVVVCPFVAPIGGNYTVVYDGDWQDWAAGSTVQVLDGPGANQVNLSKVWPNPAFGAVINPLVVNVDPATGAATIPAGVNWGDYGTYITSTLAGSTGFVFSCTGDINLKIRVSATGFGDQGALSLILKKL